MKRTALLLALLITATAMCAALAACSTNGSGDTTTAPGEAQTTAPGTDAVLTDAGGYLLDDLPDKLDYKDRTVTILYWKDVEHTEFDVDKLGGDAVEDAIYNRNLSVEERLGVQLEYIGINGNVSNIAAYVKAVDASVKSDVSDYDICGSYSSTAGTLAYEGLVLDLLDVENLNFGKPWWPQELISTSTLGNSLYFCSGDISTNLLHMMYAAFYNKEYISRFTLEDPNALVDSGKWTYEAFERMATGIYDDLNGDSKKDDGDRYGYATYWLHLDGLFGSVGIKSVEKDESDMLAVSPSYNSKKTQDFLTYINDMFASSNDWYYLGNSGADGKMQQTIFAEGRSLFLTERVRVCQNVLRFTELDYGILPIPKYNEDQENYITTMAMPFTMYTIPVNVSDSSCSGAVLECLASEGYRRVTPALFEIAMKTKYSSDSVSSRMYDLIRENVTFDLGRIFNESLAKIPNATLRNMVQEGSSTWESKYRSLDKLLRNYIKEINTSLEALE